MKLRTVFFLGFTAVCVPAVGWSTWVAGQAWVDWTQANTAVRAAEAMREVMRVNTGVAVETGQLLEAALAPAPNSDMLRRSAEVTDRALADAAASLARAGLPLAAVKNTASTMGQARLTVANAVAQPPGQRDAGLPAQILATRVGLVATLRDLVGAVETAAMQADPEVGVVAQIGSLVMEMREYAGTRSVVLTPWIRGGPYELQDVSAAAMLSGRVAQNWDRVTRAIEQVGGDTRLHEAREIAQIRFFEQNEPRYAALVAAALQRSAWPMAYADFRRWTVSALAELVPLREAIMAEAVARGQTRKTLAQNWLFAAMGLAVGTMALAAVAFWVLLGRIVLPVRALTLAVARIARGELAHGVPHRNRIDEVGEMARAIEVFRGNAAELQLTNLRFDAALNNMSQGLCLYDAAGRLAVVNRQFCEIFGLPPERVQLGCSFRDILELSIASGNHPGMSADELFSSRSAVTEGKSGSALLEIGNKRVIAVSHQTTSDGGWVATYEDVTNRRRAEEQIVFLARHDTLTGLPSRGLFNEQIEDVLARVSEGAIAGVLCLDLDRFKAVNDKLGHFMGDSLLVAVADRLRMAVRDVDIVARLGGDEFVIVQVGIKSPEDAALLAQRLVEVVGEPYELDGQHIVIGASVGVAIAPDNGRRAGKLLQLADQALYRAKLDGRGTYRFFEPEMDAALHGHRTTVDLGQAITA